MDSGSSCEVIYKHCFLKLKPSIRLHRVDSKIQLVGLSGEQSRHLREVILKVTKNNYVEYGHRSIYNSCRILRTIMVGGKPFNTKHKLNEYKHIKPVKQKKCGLAPERNEAAYAYKGYHQIQVAEGNKDKSAFFIKNGVFCYRKMPFGLKNAGETYQRLIDKVFNDQIRLNLIAYVDMAIKSASEEDMLMDIQETFNRLLRFINMKLNLKKCSFGVKEGPFLGHLITKQGIKANPSKVKAITVLKPPRTLKEIKSLNGKLTALSRFLSKGANKLLLFFKALKSCTDKKTIQWTADAEEAFRKIKKFMKILPTLTAPIKGEVLVMVLQGAELEKLILDLVYAARRLQRYFQSHLIRVLTDKPIKKILARPEKLGRIAKWAIELGEHDIEFKGRDSVKGPILADFLAKIPSAEGKYTEIKKPKAANKAPKSESTWKLYIDGASSSYSLGVGIMLVSPKGKEYTYALRFKFETTNNEAGLKMSYKTYMTVKVTKNCYFWPSMYRDAAEIIQDCPRSLGNQHHETPTNSSEKPEVLGYCHRTFHQVSGAKPLTTANGRQTKKFIWEHVICRFGVPQMITLKDDKQL
ncbi:reverse transcriptase domain-containing protein [Tanacetum coccineum]